MAFAPLLQRGRPKPQPPITHHHWSRYMPGLRTPLPAHLCRPSPSSIAAEQFSSVALPSQTGCRAEPPCADSAVVGWWLCLERERTSWRTEESLGHAVGWRRLACLGAAPPFLALPIAPTALNRHKPSTTQGRPARAPRKCIRRMDSALHPLPASFRSASFYLLRSVPRCKSDQIPRPRADSSACRHLFRKDASTIS